LPEITSRAAALGLSGLVDSHRDGWVAGFIHSLGWVGLGWDGSRFFRYT